LLVTSADCTVVVPPSPPPDPTRPRSVPPLFDAFSFVDWVPVPVRARPAPAAREGHRRAHAAWAANPEKHLPSGVRPCAPSGRRHGIPKKRELAEIMQNSTGIQAVHGGVPAVRARGVHGWRIIRIVDVARPGRCPCFPLSGEDALGSAAAFARPSTPGWPVQRPLFKVRRPSTARVRPEPCHRRRRRPHQVVPQPVEPLRRELCTFSQP
jgi:hypothetical protein